MGKCEHLFINIRLCPSQFLRAHTHSLGYSNGRKITLDFHDLMLPVGAIWSDQKTYSSAGMNGIPLCADAFHSQIEVNIEL